MYKGTNIVLFASSTIPFYLGVTSNSEKFTFLIARVTVSITTNTIVCPLTHFTLTSLLNLNNSTNKTYL